ncbi:MAG TPA: peptide chain release factor N(5)-glutamine methyltransferase [Candidatus Omnitrophica bacterium]|nr:peptide chain release factor N(5)-glutamine methyltransferase [Candidatus Omnitrophota bacterium]
MSFQRIGAKEMFSSFIEELQDYSPHPMRELEYIVMGIKSLPSRSLLYTTPVILQEGELDNIRKIIKLRKEGVPLQYLLGEVNFYGLEFKIKPGVFIPRPETEILVDYIINNYRRLEKPRILEVGTGSGVISICLTKFLPESKIIATDINAEALELAEENAKLHKVKIDFIQANLFDFLSSSVRFDLIISNPPYVGRREYNFLSPEVKAEPQEAVIGGEQGYEFTLRFITEADKYIAEGGRLVVEIDYRAKDTYIKMLSEKYRLQFLPDFNSRERVMIVEKKYG